MTTISKINHIVMTRFVRRQTVSSPFTHWTFSELELVTRVAENFRHAERGYREGVLLVPIDPSGLYTGICQLQEGDELRGYYRARKPGEEPRKGCYVVGGRKLPAKSVKVVLYSHATLLETGENETDADWEIISVNGSPTEGDVPMSVGTLIANHFQLSGGTDTNMTDSEFVSALHNSVHYWKDKAMVFND